MSVDQPMGETPQSNIYGDWFACEDPDCNNVGFVGWRIRPDGNIHQMYSEPPYLESDEQYCYTHRPELNLTYTFVDSVLKIVTYNNTNYSVQVESVGDFMVVRILHTGKTERWKRIVPVRDKGSCDKFTPWVCPIAVDTGSKSCSWEWICDNGDYSLECGPSTTGNGYDCTCINANGAVDGKFTSADVCQTASIKGPIDLTNLKCNWQLWFPPI
jgi:hypothetical protein